MNNYRNVNPIENILREFPLMILDGAMATELERHGYDLNDNLWSAKVLIENPEIIKQIHMDYFRVGADCAITASYQTTAQGFIKRGLSEAEAFQLIKKSVQIATEARDEFWSDSSNHFNRPKPLVAASIGPYGAFLADGSEYRGDYNVTEDELMDFHRERMEILIHAGADVLACETIPCLIEAKAIARLLEGFSGTYAWISFSAKDELHICSGELITDCAKWLDKSEQVVAVGINCTQPRYIPPLIKEIRHQTNKPIVVYPNLGEEYDPKTKTWHGASVQEDYGTSAQIWHECGAQLIGGCCRTKPEDIKRIVDWAREKL